MRGFEKAVRCVPSPIWYIAGAVALTLANLTGLALMLTGAAMVKTVWWWVGQSKSQFHGRLKKYGVPIRVCFECGKPATVQCEWVEGDAGKDGRVYLCNAHGERVGNCPHMPGFRVHLPVAPFFNPPFNRRR